MTTFDWHSFLRGWSKDLLERLNPETFEQLPNQIIQAEWFGRQGASPTEIERLEIRLGSALPTSYRQFLLTTNGWLQPDPHFTQLWSTKEVDWFAASNQKTIDIWLKYSGQDLPPVSDEQYFVYGENQDPISMRAEYLPDTLSIGYGRDSVNILLNPRVKDANGEWEAWFLASWLPGAERYRSFLELMEVRHDIILSDYPKLRDL